MNIVYMMNQIMNIAYPIFFFKFFKILLQDREIDCNVLNIIHKMGEKEEIEYNSRIAPFVGTFRSRNTKTFFRA